MTTAERYKANKEQIQSYSKDYYKKNKVEFLTRAKKQRLLNRYGLTVDDYNTMFEEQNGCCYICGTHQSELNKALSVDHCHINGHVRKLLCMRCNAGLGNFNDDPELLNKALQYVKEF